MSLQAKLVILYNITYTCPVHNSPQNKTMFESFKLFFWLFSLQISTFTVIHAQFFLTITYKFCKILLWIDFKMKNSYCLGVKFTTVQKFGLEIFVMFVKVASAHQGYIYLIEKKKCLHVVKCNLFLWCKAEFSASLLQSSVSHDPSEIILIYWFAAQKTFFA